jgi:uncharacterized protein (DUF885 family)
VTDSEPLSPVDQLGDRFWESILELNPTTATVYGDERYNDRLEDPSPAGRAKARRLMERTKAEAEAISPDGLSVEDRITRDMLIVIADQAIEQDDQGVHRLGVVDQIAGPQTLLPQVCQFQPADTPERLEKFLARPAPGESPPCGRGVPGTGRGPDRADERAVRGRDADRA